MTAKWKTRITSITQFGAAHNDHNSISPPHKTNLETFSIFQTLWRRKSKGWCFFCSNVTLFRIFLISWSN